jgi:response regulator RpfG family c-di-GMP phosphodiesterase
MSKTLVICDNEFLKTLYVLNLEVYLATEVSIFSTLNEGIDFHKKKKNFDLIISLEKIQKMDSLSAINEYKSGYAVNTPLVVVGGDSDQDVNESTFIISSRYNIQGILKKAASILGVTAKKMAELQMNPFYPISTAPIDSLVKAPCNIYENNEDQYKLIAQKDESLVDIMRNLKAGGTDKVYVKSTDRLVLVNQVSFKLIERLTDALKNSSNAPMDKKIELTIDSFEFVAANLFSSEEIRQEMAEIANASAKVMSDVIKDNGNLKSLLATMTVNKGGYIFIHSMITSYVANHIIKNVTWGGDNQSDKINFILFFHDIYLAPIFLRQPSLRFEKDLLSSPLINEKEKETIMNHAKLAAELVVNYKRCPMGADVLIKHHHGMKKGMGFATKYPEDLSPLSKVLLVAEAFVEHFIEANDKKEKMEMRNIIPKLVEQFSTQSYIKIVQTLVNLPI